MSTPDSRAARRIVLPAFPRAGKRACRGRVLSSDSFSKVLREIFQCASDGKRRHATHRAQGSVDHRIAELVEQMNILFAVLVRDDAVDYFHTPHRADAAGRAFAAGLDRAELHSETRLLGH